MYTPESRTAIRDSLVRRAVDDARLMGVALTGSAAIDREDRWSDIDLAVGVAAGVPVEDVIEDWSNHMRRTFGVVDTVDITSRSTVYRVFLLPDTLQVDIAFAPRAEFGALAPTFRLLAGTASDQVVFQPPAIEHLIGMAWLYALHVRSSIGRGRLLQAQHMLGGLRDHVIMLACRRHDLPAAQGRGADDLPDSLMAALAATHVAAVSAAELGTAFEQVVQLLETEVMHGDPDRAAALAPVLAELVASARPPLP